MIGWVPLGQRVKQQFYIEVLRKFRERIVRVQYFARGGFVGHRSRVSSKHLSSHLPVDGVRFLGGQKGLRCSCKIHVWVSGPTKTPTAVGVRKNDLHCCVRWLSKGSAVSRFWNFWERVLKYLEESNELSTTSHTIECIAPITSDDDPDLAALYSRQAYFDDRHQQALGELSSLPRCDTPGCRVHSTPCNSPTKNKTEEFPELPKKN
ncbi:hypothetical protein TNCV_3144451 [Trichonephila clavipes]|nr:hypothetical protein TNCV_3144451 [Trichonephila clavipes]